MPVMFQPRSASRRAPNAESQKQNPLLSRPGGYDEHTPMLLAHSIAKSMPRCSAAASSCPYARLEQKVRKQEESEGCAPLDHAWRSLMLVPAHRCLCGSSSRSSAREVAIKCHGGSRSCQTSRFLAQNTRAVAVTRAKRAAKTRALQPLVCAASPASIWRTISLVFILHFSQTCKKSFTQPCLKTVSVDAARSSDSQHALII